MVTKLDIFENCSQRGYFTEKLIRGPTGNVKLSFGDRYSVLKSSCSSMSPTSDEYQVVSLPSSYGPDQQSTSILPLPYLDSYESKLGQPQHHYQQMPDMFSNLNSSQQLLGVAPSTADRNTKELSGSEHQIFKDNRHTVELGALLQRVHRVLSQVAGNQKEQELKNFFQNLRKSKEPNLCKDSCPSLEHSTSSSKDDGIEVSGLPVGRRHSLGKIFKRHAKKRQKKEANNSSEDTDVKNDLNSSTERLKDSSAPSICISASPDGAAHLGGACSSAYCPPSSDTSTSRPCVETRLDSLRIGDTSSSPSSTECTLSHSAASQRHSQTSLKRNSSCHENFSQIQPSANSSLDLRCPSQQLVASTKSVSDSRLLTEGAEAAGGPSSSADNQGLSCCSQEKENMSLLQKLAYNALNLTAPASSLLLSEGRNNWVQLSGHPGSLAPAGPGTVWKKRDPESTETDTYRKLMQDEAASTVVPTFFREIHYGDDYFIEMRDLLSSFHNPCIMDIKMGTRTFLEGEVSNAKPRKDLYQKMVKVSPDEPTSEEREAEAVTKLRYMDFRDTLSSSRQLGFRIEAMKMHESPAVTDLQKVRCRQEVVETMTSFMKSRDSVRRHVLAQLHQLRDGFERSDFFSGHEVIGSSILVVFDDDKAGIWIIDFAKTRPLPEGVSVTHRDPWVMGNHEEGFLFGLDNLIEIVKELKMSKSRKFSLLRGC